MNVTFHALGSFATAAVLSARLLPCDNCFFLRSDLPCLAVGFGAGVLLHGLLDFAPHSYPFSVALDIVLCLLLFAAFALLVRRRNFFLLVVCYLGSLFPDLIDLLPAMINKRLNLGLPVVKVFPWHWHEYSGSIYNGSRQFESNLCHLLLLAASVILLVIFKRRLFWIGDGVRKQGRG